LSYNVDDNTTKQYFSVNVTEDGLAVEVRPQTGAHAIQIVPDKWNMIDIEVFEDPTDDIVKAKFSRRAEDINAEDINEISSVFELWDSQYFKLSPKTSHYSKKQFNLEFPSQTTHRTRSWIKDLTFIGSKFN
jgi:hypothetical protein